MPIRSKFLADRAISNEEFERGQQINAWPVSDLPEAPRVSFGATFDESLRQAMNEDWLARALVLPLVKVCLDDERLQAQDERLKLELAHLQEGRAHELVLLAAADEAGLRRTHARFFEAQVKRVGLPA